ncbi:MAG: TonB-dependent receptor [Spirochaetaceae bacterium]|nr:TonB-dependent receptor [Myxococcales bacterium]MCB9724798.1 TonB-dependent receptor [Spirochaetaceae bacterium]
MLVPAGASALDEENQRDESTRSRSSTDPWAGVEVMEVVGAGTAALLTAEIQTSAIAFDADALAALRVTDVRDLATVTPNLEIKTGAGASNATIFIRGIGLNDFNANASSSVAIFNDGVNVNSPAGQLFQLFDVEGSDVLRGPQGTLYGRNVTAGAIRVFSKKPGDETDARFAFTYGNYNNVEADGGLTIPIVPDLLSVRFSGKFRMRDGITKNRCADSPNVGRAIDGDCFRTRTPFVGAIPDNLPKWVNEIDNWGGRVLVRLTPIEPLEFMLNVHGGRSEGDARQNQARGTQGFSGVPPRYGVTIPAYSDRDDDPYAGAYDIVANEYLELFGTSLTSRLDLGWATLTSITAYEQNDRAFLDNTDAAPILALVVDLKDGARQWSQDLRLESSLDNGFEWKLGALFMTEKVFGNNRFLSAGNGLAQPTRQRLKQQFYHGAIFGFASYELTETLKVEGGIRFGWERKDFKNRSWRYSSRTGDRIPPQPFSGKEEAEWSPVTGDAILTWSPLEDLDVYLKYARGWKTGHFNGGAARPDVLIDPVQPEHVNGFELGLRSQWLDGRLGLNAALYYYDYKNYQVFALQNQPDGLPLPQLLNAQDVESRGFEVELQTEPWDGVRWNAALGWVEAKFGTFTSTTFRLAQSRTLCGGLAFCSLPNNDDFTGNRLPAAPAFSFSTNIEADIPIGRLGVLTPRLDASYKTKLFFDHQGDDALSQGPFWLLHARLAYTVPDGRVSLALWVKNVTDEAYLLQAFDLRLLAGTIIDTYGEPRTFGATMTLNY